jgi:hypothetical protein
MHKTLMGVAAAASIGLASLATPSPANAGCWGPCVFGAALLGGLVGGAIVSSAAPPPPPPYYGPPPYPPPPPGVAYGPPPGAAYAPPPAYAQLAPGCHWGHRRVWVEGVGYRRETVPVCP